MKLFVCEFITGGGLNSGVLPPSLAKEGADMRDALLRDLLDIDDISILTTFDARLADPLLTEPTIAVQGSTHCAVAITASMDSWSVWESCIVESDAVWLIAPETNGVLARLSTLVIHHNKILIGSIPEAIEITSSKWATYRFLQSAKINTVPTYRFDTWHSRFLQDITVSTGTFTWVGKKDDGVGCEDSRVFNNTHELARWMANREATHIIQPYQRGLAASISMLCKDGQAWLLSCNEQKVVINTQSITLKSDAETDSRMGEFSYHGSLINGMARHRSEFELIAKQVAALLPGLAGYIGIDLIVEEDKSGKLAKLSVLEINPRLTTSYVGLRRAIGHNPAKLILDLLLTNVSGDPGIQHDKNQYIPFQMPSILRQPVEVFLDA